MASPAKIAQELPDTLPEDFGEWDGGESPAIQPGNPGGAESAPGFGIVPKPATQPAETQVAAAHSGNLLRGTPLPTPASEYADDGAFLHRVRSLSPAVDRTPAAVASPRQAAAPAIDEARFSAPRSNGSAVNTAAVNSAAATAVRKTPVVQAAAMSEADEVLFQSFRSNGAEAKQPTPAKKKWPMIAAISGASALALILVLFLVLNHGKASAAKPAAVSQPTVTVIEQPDPSAAKPSPSAPASGKHPAADDAQDSSDAQPAADQGDANTPQVQSQMMNDQLNAPARIQRTKTETAEEAPPSASFGAAGMDALGNNNAIGSVFGNEKGPKVQAAAPRVVNVSAGVAVGLLIQRTPPVYPQIAKAARVSGTVVLQATISKTGAISNIHVVSGPVMLRQAAADAVKTWRYRPYRLNNEPTEIETTINVIFSLVG